MSDVAERVFERIERESKQASCREREQHSFARAQDKAAPLQRWGIRSGRAFAPEEVGRQADEKEDDGGGQIHELGRVAKSEIDGIGDDGPGDEDEEKGSPWVAGNAIGNRAASGSAANGENRGGAESVENPANKNHTSNQTAERA